MSTEANSLSDVLFGQMRGEVLGFLYGQPDKTFYVRQIARQLDASVGTIQRELEKLRSVGLIVRSSVGNQVFYQANQDSPVFAEMRGLLAKTVGVFEVLSSALKPLSRKISCAFVYGSVARQEETAQSDVDLLLVGSMTLDDVLSRMPLPPLQSDCALGYRAAEQPGHHLTTIESLELTISADANVIQRLKTLQEQAE